VRAGTWVPGRVHGREEIRRNLLRLSGLQALVLEDPPVPGVASDEGAPGSPIERAYRLLTVNTLLFSTLRRARVAVRAERTPEDLLGYFLALLPGMAFPERPEDEARSVFTGHLAVALETAPPARVPVAAMHGRIRGRLFDLLGLLRAGSEGRAGLPVALDIAGRVYYLGDALGLYERLAPPAAPSEIGTGPSPCPTTSTNKPVSSPRPPTRYGSRSSRS
jgi:hypothetical protein